MVGMCSHHASWPAGAILALALLAAPAYAAELPDKPVDLRGSEIQIFIENDSFRSSDQYYTNGIKIGGGIPADKVSKLFTRPPNALLDAITEGASNHFGLFLGQNMYTPRDITIAAAQPYDRPWAAWLYIGAVAQSVKDDRLHTVEFDLGMVGPPALGEPVQKFWHDLINAAEPKGWDNQIRGEPGFMISYLHKRRYGDSNGLQFVPHAGVTLGTIMTQARAGGLLRVGQNMTGFGPDSIEPGGAMLKNTRRQQDEGRYQSWEWFAFAGVDGRLVAHNIFLDGSLFRDGPSIASNNKVYDVTAGLSARVDKVRLSVTRIKRSEEFDGGGKQRFYSINFGIEF
ncbi:MAG: lipid A deacylase LpxR family protein [Betaproteobacteria bacterium]|nr:MAG: lipid A deacylase LpxR family protein [Betaproteobacteria bacterium]